MNGRMQAMGIFTLLSLIFNISCGDKPAVPKSDSTGDVALNKDGLVLIFSFTKNNPESLQSALDNASKFIKEKHESALNQIIQKLGLKNIRLEHTHFSAAGVQLPELFQTIRLAADLLRYHDEGGSRTKFGAVSIFERKLVWPDLSQKDIDLISTTYDDLVFPADKDEGAEAIPTWKMQISYRTLLSSFIRSNGILLFEDAASEALNKQFRLPNHCTNMQTVLTNFIQHNFNDLGDLKDVDCAVIEKKISYKDAFGIDRVEAKEYTELKFSLAAKSFAFNGRLRDKGGIPEDLGLFNSVVTVLLLERYDRIFGKQ
jgi:hypothetical protein